VLTENGDLYSPRVFLERRNQIRDEEFRKGATPELRRMGTPSANFCRRIAIEGKEK